MVITFACSFLLAVPCRAQETTHTNSPSWTNLADGEIVRFVRIEYACEDWEDGMDPESDADVNFLKRLHDLCGVPVATNSESVTIRTLGRKTQNMPPIVFITGSKSFRLAMYDMTILREYLLAGGMLFADCGSREWHRTFIHHIRMIFPDKPIVEIPDDDVLFKEPFILPNGALPMWHHGGNKVLGVKHEGRWIVVYPPGDINDAWEFGYSKEEPALAENAYRLGINFFYYAWNQKEKNN